MKSDQEYAEELWRVFGQPIGWKPVEEAVSRILSEVRQQEREECAKIAEKLCEESPRLTGGQSRIAQALRFPKEVDSRG